MSKKKYSEKLKDPRWQKKRLEILERDNWICQSCADNESTLHVHHKIYLNNAEPWEYDNKYLLTLCEHCHEYEYVHQKQSVKAIGDAFLLNGFLSAELEIIAESVAKMHVPFSAEVFTSALCHYLDKEGFTSSLVDGYFKYLKEKGEEVSNG